ncbi:MAG: M43 family zinc metalloprotease [Bacteroidota bacterium]
MRKLIQENWPHWFWSLSVMWLIGVSSVQAQKPVEACGTEDFMEEIRAEHPSWPDRHGFETWLARKAQSEVAQSLRGTVITIPVIVHIIHDGEAVGTGTNLSQSQVNSQIEVLNEDFRRMLGTPGYNTHPDGADIEIEFCLATVDPANQVLSEPGIERISRQSLNLSAPPYTISFTKNNILSGTIWNPDDYMNIWTVNLANDFLGFAQLPDSSTLGDLSPIQGPANTDGVVITPTAFGREGMAAFPYNGGRSGTHEVGHWMGLRHTWGDGNCSQDDYCSDTPTTDGANYGCPTGEPSCSATPAMIENYMEYTDDACMSIFTECQKTRMRTVMANSVRRASLLNSLACSGQVAPISDFSVNQREVCAGSRLQFQAESPGASTWSWSFQGGTPSTSTQQNPQIDYFQPGTYSVSLTVSNSIGSDDETKSGWITVTDNGPNIFYVEDFEGGLSGWAIENNDLLDTWQLVDVGGIAGDRAMYVNMYYYTNVGQRDGLISPALDVSTHDNVSLSFDYAYRQYSSDDQDSLIVYVSTDGGNSFPHRIFAQGEDGTGNFATEDLLTSNFVPAFSIEWCGNGMGWASCPELDLSPYQGNGSVVLRFETYNDYGNNIFIDNIRLEGTCKPVQVSVEDQLVTELSWNIYPNPGEDFINLQFAQLSRQAIQLDILDLQGKSLARQSLPPTSGDLVHRWNLPEMAAGLYLVRAQIGAETFYRKWVRN